jgi:hypothetical protein
MICCSASYFVENDGLECPNGAIYGATTPFPQIIMRGSIDTQIRARLDSVVQSLEISHKITEFEIGQLHTALK